MQSEENNKYIEFNRSSVLTGRPLERFKQMTKSYREGFVDLDEIIINGRMCGFLHESVEEVCTAMQSLKEEEKRKEKQEANRITYDDYKPDRWDGNDAGVTEKIDLYINFLQKSLDSVNYKTQENNQQ